MKKIYLFLFLILSLVMFASSLTITDRIKLIVLSGKPGTNWSEGEVNYLLSVLEEQAVNLGRFQLFPRVDLDKILQERNLSEIGIAEAQEFGKISGYKYALLLTLSSITTEKAGTLGEYRVVSRYSLKLYNLDNAELISTKAFESIGTSSESAQKAISNAIQNMAFQIAGELRRLFRLEAYVKSFEGNYIILSGLNPALARIGMIFSTEAVSNATRLKVINIDSANGRIVTEVISGPKPSLNQRVIEEVDNVVQGVPQTTQSTVPANLERKQGITFGIGASFESSFGFGGWGLIIHSGEVLPLLIYLSVNDFEYMYYNLSVADLGAGISIGKFLGSKNYVLVGSSYVYVNFEGEEAEIWGVSLGILSDFSFGNLGLYLFSEIGINYLIPFLITQIGIRYSF